MKYESNISIRKINTSIDGVKKFDWNSAEFLKAVSTNLDGEFELENNPFKSDSCHEINHPYSIASHHNLKVQDIDDEEEHYDEVLMKANQQFIDINKISEYFAGLKLEKSFEKKDDSEEEINLQESFSFSSCDFDEYSDMQSNDSSNSSLVYNDDLWGKFKTGEDKEFCCICISDIEDGQNVRFTPCGHAFHYECSQKWFKTKKMCPTCRFDVI